MEKEFVPYELALKMKQLGYKKEGVDEDCFAFYDEEEYLFTVREQDDIDEEWLIAPTFSQAFRWFRKKYFIHGEPKYKGGLTKETAWYDYIIISNIDWDDSKIKNKQYKTYEEAELACLEKLIEIVENNLVD